MKDDKMKMSKSEMKMNKGKANMKMDGGMDMGEMKMGYMVPKDKVVGDNIKTGGNPEFNYNYLRAKEPTEFENDKPVLKLICGRSLLSILKSELMSNGTCCYNGVNGFLQGWKQK
jgi:hypothetical protein